MRTFEDRDGQRWRATVRERPGQDYKGRFYFYLEPVDDGGGEAEGDGIPLLDIRWNSLKTAERTLETMSLVELRRRLRSARGRDRSPTDPSL